MTDPTIMLIVYNRSFITNRDIGLMRAKALFERANNFITCIDCYIYSNPILELV